MDWVNRDEGPENLLTEFASRPTNQNSEFSPLVNGLLSTGTTPAVAGEWPIPHVTRNVRNDFRYEFSLSAGPEFDTESADGDDRAKPEEDTVSTDGNQGASTSEDTSIGVDPSVGSGKEPMADADDMSVHRPPPGMSPTREATMIPSPDEEKKLIKAQIAEINALHTRENVDNADAGSILSKPSAHQKASKVIQKKKAGLAAKKPAGKTTPPSNQAMSVSGGTSAVQSGAPSHTKLCRDRLNNMFEQLRHTLPPAPAGVEVKHKAQVLDYAIVVLKSMVERTSQLEIELAVSSNKATMDWISKLVNKVDTFPQAGEEVMNLFSKRRGWRHAELWTAEKKQMAAGSDPEESTVLSFCVAVGNDAMRHDGLNLEQFSKESETYAFKAKEGVQGRVWSSMRPEWVTGLSDVKKFRRASLATKYGLKVCLAVPVTITGKIEAVMCFYDVKHRPFDTQCVELAMRLAWALGNAVGGKRARVNVLTTSGTSST